MLDSLPADLPEILWEHYCSQHSDNLPHPSITHLIWTTYAKPYLSCLVQFDHSCLLCHTLVEKRVQLLVIINLDLPLKVQLCYPGPDRFFCRANQAWFAQLFSALQEWQLQIRTSCFCIPVVGFAILIFMTYIWPYKRVVLCQSGSWCKMPQTTSTCWQLILFNQNFRVWKGEQPRLSCQLLRVCGCRTQKCHLPAMWPWAKHRSNHLDFWKLRMDK